MDGEYSRIKTKKHGSVALDSTGAFPSNNSPIKQHRGKNSNMLDNPNTLLNLDLLQSDVLEASPKSGGGPPAETAGSPLNKNKSPSAVPSAMYQMSALEQLQRH